jgi:hypothetical protein
MLKKKKSEGFFKIFAKIKDLFYIYFLFFLFKFIVSHHPQIFRLVSKYLKKKKWRVRWENKMKWKNEQPRYSSWYTKRRGGKKKRGERMFRIYIYIYILFKYNSPSQSCYMFSIWLPKFKNLQCAFTKFSEFSMSLFRLPYPLNQTKFASRAWYVIF